MHAFIGLDGPYWTDSATNPNNEVDEDEGELNSDAKGLWIRNFDFGMAIMKPTNPLDFVKYFALKASAEDISIVNIEGVDIDAHDILVEVNQSSPSIYGVPLFPVVDFASTFDEDERLTLFNIFASAGDSEAGVSPADLDEALGIGHGVTQTLTTVEQLVELLTHGGAPPDAILSLDFVLDQLDSTFKETHFDLIVDADADSDGKFDPIGYEVNTGGDPVYLTMDSPLIRAQGFLQLTLFDNIFLTGSIAFELGPTQEVTVTDGNTPTIDTMMTMTIGAANVTAFIGVNGPYWTDLDGDHEVSWTDAAGNPLNSIPGGFCRRRRRRGRNCGAGRRRRRLPYHRSRHRHRGDAVDRSLEPEPLPRRQAQCSQLRAGGDRRPYCDGHLRRPVQCRYRRVRLRAGPPSRRFPDQLHRSARAVRSAGHQ